MVINKSAPGWSAFSRDHYTSLDSSRMGIRIFTHREHDHLFCYDDQQVSTRMWDQELHSRTIIILHYIAINKLSSRMGIRIYTHRIHDHLICYDDQQVGTWLDCILTRSLYFII